MISDFQKAWGKRTFENVKYSLSPDNNYTESGNGKAIYLTTVESKIKGKGYARKFLKELISVADSTKTVLSLIPDADTNQPGALNQKQLESVYLKLGFMATKIQRDGMALEMIRNPRNND